MLKHVLTNLGLVRLYQPRDYMGAYCDIEVQLILPGKSPAAMFYDRGYNSGMIWDDDNPWELEIQISFFCDAFLRTDRFFFDRPWLVTSGQLEWRAQPERRGLC